MGICEALDLNTEWKFPNPTLAAKWLVEDGVLGKIECGPSLREIGALIS